MAFPPLRKPTITCACHLLRSKELVAALVSLFAAGCTLHPTNPAPRPGPELAEFSADAKTETIAPVGYPATYQALLAACAQWLSADGVLTNLPPTMPSEFFASSTHLNERGAARYTEALAGQLKPHLRPR